MSTDSEVSNQPPSGPTQEFQLTSILSEEIGASTLWLKASFAPKWFADALTEASQPQADARRREVLFAVAVAESYLLEWVRDDVLKRNFADLDRFFPPDGRQPIIDKWKEVPKKLKCEGLITAIPNLGGGSAWGNFKRLVEFRNGLLHARSSRPKTVGTPEANLPLPSLDDLQRLEAGWPTQVVCRLIRELHSSVGTSPPHWLTNP